MVTHIDMNGQEAIERAGAVLAKLTGAENGLLVSVDEALEMFAVLTIASQQLTDTAHQLAKLLGIGNFTIAKLPDEGEGGQS